ncbi:MAG: hypothetical protein ACRETR_06535 [Steroidobacteraceae bacterium]
MSRDLDGATDFERQLQTLLETSVQGVGGHARSRLNQARHAALAEAARSGHWSPLALAATWLRLRLWMPVAGAMAAAVLVAFVLWPNAPQAYPAADSNHTTVEDLDLIADREGMDLMQGDSDGQFYEWAVAQTDQGGQPAGTGAASPDKSHGAQNAGAVADQNSG